MSMMQYLRHIFNEKHKVQNCVHIIHIYIYSHIFVHSTNIFLEWYIKHLPMLAATKLKIWCLEKKCAEHLLLQTLL